MPIIETKRLILSQLTLDDIPFILSLLNEPAFHEYIGDKGVRSAEEAAEYLEEGPIASYEINGFGLYLTSLKEGNVPIGISGIKKRDSMNLPELGYAFLQKHWSNGYATEAGRGVMDYACTELGLTKIAALTAPNNEGSIRVLEKIGFEFKEMVELPGFDTVNKLFLYNC